MAFSILSEFIRDVGEKYFPAPTKDEAVGIARSPVLRIVYPTRRLIDQTDPHEYTNAASTDITRHWRKE